MYKLHANTIESPSETANISEIYHRYFLKHSSGKGTTFWPEEERLEEEKKKKGVGERERR